MTQRGTWNGGLLGLAQLGILIVFVATLIGAQGAPEGVRAAVFIGLGLAAVTLGVFGQIRGQQRLDEVEVAAMRFGAQWSTVAATLLLILTLFLPPMHALLIGLESWFEPSPGYAPVPAPVGTFVMGGFAVLGVQAVAALALRAVWMRSKS
jgi:hypothetical protein